MCIGIPMCVLESGEVTSLCEGRGERRRINMLMVGNCPAGTWVMTFLGTARDILSKEDAADINRTLDELEAMMGGSFDSEEHLRESAGRG